MSGNRRRIIEGDFNLDLTYITPQIIAMSYPSSGLEGIYRNDIKQVSSVATHQRLGLELLEQQARRQLLDF